MKRSGIGIIISFIFCFAIFFFAVPFEKTILEEQIEVSPLANVKQSAWLDIFSNTGLICLGIALLGVIVWSFWGYSRYRIVRWQNAGGKLDRLLISSLTFASVLLYGWFYTEPTQDWGKHIACLFYAINTFIVYWLTTAMFSPSSVKYAPLWSTRLAPIGNWIMRLVG